MRADRVLTEFRRHLDSLDRPDRVQRDLLTGAIITEQIFSWPGLGRLLIQSITTRDYPQVQASILVIALTYIMVNFISDLLYGVVDPRIKLE